MSDEGVRWMTGVVRVSPSLLADLQDERELALSALKDDRPSDQVLFSNFDLNWAEWVWFLKMYRILRIAVYAPSSYCGDGDHYQGCYGMSRDEARGFLRPIIREVSWHAYLGSK